MIEACFMAGYCLGIAFRPVSICLLASKECCCLFACLLAKLLLLGFGLEIFARYESGSRCIILIACMIATFDVLHVFFLCMAWWLVGWFGVGVQNSVCILPLYTICINITLLIVILQSLFPKTLFIFIS